MILKRELGKNNNRLCDWSFEIISLNLISSQWTRWHDCLVYMRSRFIRRHCQNARQQQVANIIYSTANNIWEERVSVCTGVSVYLCPSLLSSPSTCKSVLSLYVAPTTPSCVVVTTEHSYWKATLLYMYVFYYYSSILITTVETCASSHTLLPNGQWWEVQVIWMKTQDGQQEVRNTEYLWYAFKFLHSRTP